MKNIEYEQKIQLANSVSIIDVVSINVDLRKSGNKLAGRCPFHEEKYPSFFIYPNTNSFYCFGCNKGGGVIDFVKLQYKYDFKQAVEYLIGGMK